MLDSFETPLMNVQKHPYKKSIYIKSNVTNKNYFTTFLQTADVTNSY